MEKTNVQKLAKILKVLVTITLVCNLIVLLFVPGLVGIGAEGGIVLFQEAVEENPFVPAPFLFFLANWQYWWRIWRVNYTGVLAGFLMVCGVCTALILWQARKVLNTILAGDPFQKKNGESMKHAAVCCFVISAAALIRTFWRFWYYGSFAPLFTYNALFVPLFAMGGLLCMVMSALFRQAAELKEENDLTI